MIALFADVAALLAIVGCAYVVLATVLTQRFLARRAATAAVLPAVTLIKPLHGVYPGMARVLEAFCDQDHDAPVQIVFGIQDPADPAGRVVEALIARRPDADITLVIDGVQHGGNRKVSNVINIADQARHGVLVLSDGDITVGRDYLRKVTGALAGEGVGAVTCPYVGHDNGDIWPALGSMAINYGFLPNAILGKTLGLAEPCLGSTIALTAETLDAIGGFRAFADHLADDYEIGRAVRGLGLSIAMPPMVVGHLGLDTGPGALIDHELRWGKTVRQIDPGGYAGSVITNPLPLALIAAALMGFSTFGLVLILATLGVRIACKFAMDEATGARAGHWWMIPARDVLSFVVFLASFTVGAVGWQGRRFRVGRDGVLSQT